MADLLKVVVTGASGRMGQTLINLITKNGKLELVGALERSNHERTTLYRNNEDHTNAKCDA